MKTAVKPELKSDQYLSEGSLFLLWQLLSINNDKPHHFEFGFEYIKPFDWNHKKMMDNLFALSDQFGIRLQNPRFESGYFKDQFPDDYKKIEDLTIQQLTTKPDPKIERFLNFFHSHSKEHAEIRGSILEEEVPITMEDVKKLLLDIMPINIKNSLLEGIWFEVKIDEKPRKKITKFLDNYLSNFINNKLIGKPQDLSSLSIRPQNFYTFEKHKFWGSFKLKDMREKYGNRFIVLGSVDKSPEFLYIHFLLASEKLGYIKIHRLSTNSGAYTHGDDPEWEAVITLQPSFNNPDSVLTNGKEKTKTLKIGSGSSLGVDKKREWIDFFKKMEVVKTNSKRMGELEKELDGFAPLYGSMARNLLKETDDIITEMPAELKKLDWVFREYNSTPYSLNKSKSIIIASLDKLSEKYETIPLVYTTLPLPSPMNYSSLVWREIFSIHSFEKEDYGHIDFLNALVSLISDKVIGLLFFETISANDQSLVFKVTITGYNKKPEIKKAIDSEPLQRAREPLHIVIDEVKKDIGIKGLEEKIILSRSKGKKIRLPNFPSDLRWEEISIRFLNEHEVIVKARNETLQTTYEAMGFQDEKRKLPNKQWVLLRLLAVRNGELSWENNSNLSLKEINKIKKQKQLLSETLKAFFQIGDDPFHDYKAEKSYRIKLNLTPEPELKDMDEREVIEDNDKIGLKNYYKEQTPEVNDG